MFVVTFTVQKGWIYLHSHLWASLPTRPFNSEVLQGSALSQCLFIRYAFFSTGLAYSYFFKYHLHLDSSQILISNQTTLLRTRCMYLAAFYTSPFGETRKQNSDFLSCKPAPPLLFLTSARDLSPLSCWSQESLILPSSHPAYPNIQPSLCVSNSTPKLY